MSWLKIVVVLGCLGVKMIGDAMKALKSTPPATVAAAAAAASSAASEDTAGGSKKAGLMGLNWHAASIVGIVWYAISLTILAVATLNYVYVYRKYTRERQPLKINRFVWSLLFLIGTASLVYLISILAISANS
ncbi:hypothetical protein GQ42DRAFT_10901 [Ramicandelaber brevisporus]|nr:hypothetical protein GQ42DRAFT_10901 [Ramicandelaber brevisporus]